jgi:hypothetical protein
LDQAYGSTKLGNIIVQDQILLCQLISKRVDFENVNKMNALKSALENDEPSHIGMLESSFSDDGNLEEGSVDSVS